MTPNPNLKRIKPPKPPKKGGKLAMFAMLSFVLGGGFYFSHKTDDIVVEYDAKKTAVAAFVGDKDDLTPYQKELRLGEFKSEVAKEGIDVAIFDAQTASDKVIQNKDMSNEERTSLLNFLVANPQTKVAELVLWDDVAEDGDVVVIESATTNVSVALMHVPKTVYVPVVVGQAIQIRGVKDGGGGITLAFISGNSSVAAPVLGVGETISTLLY